MWICVVFLAGGLLISGTAADGDIDGAEDAVRPGGACESFGRRFCNVPCREPPGSNDTFSCECPSEEFYFDAVEQFCLYKNSCKTTKCSRGFCRDGRNKVHCTCEGIPNISLNCKVVDKYYQEECEEIGGLVLMPTRPGDGPRCVCGNWAKRDDVKKKCVPTTCLKPTVTCKELCEKRLLGKDPRCCQGWNETDCTREPENGTYCSPGSLMNAQGKCQDACSAREARLICPNGCQPTSRGSMTYKCRCPPNRELAEDGISCQPIYKLRPCRDDEKKACRSDEHCEVRDEKINCQCRFHEHIVDGVCTDKCRSNNCHENFQNCVIRGGKEGCKCPWNDWKKVSINDKCTLQRYYYTVSFKPNISLEHEDCDFHISRVLEAMRTALGSRVHSVEILNCTSKIEARLILNETLPKLLKKKLQMCEYQEGDFCMLYPSLPIEKGSATGIEEENLCESVLKEQEAAYNGTNKCVKQGNLFWFKCAPGFKEVNHESSGRFLRRSICKPETDDATVKPGACESFGSRFCNGPCREPPGSNDTFSCECPSDEFYFDAVEQFCLYKNSCKTTKCSRGFCRDGRNKVYCTCEGIPNISLNCKVVDKYYQQECEERGGQVLMPTSPGDGPRCVCGDWAKSDDVKKKCVPTTCLKPTVTCKELCEKRLLGKDPRCCQGWNETDCTREPENGTYCSPGSLMNAQGKCQDACSAREARLICPNGCQPTSRGSMAYKCRCPPNRELAEDGISCQPIYKLRPCRDDEKKACRSDEHCEVRDEKINCRCRFHEHFVDGVCTDKCRSNNCHENFQNCVIRGGKEGCKCPWNDWKKEFINDKCTLQRYYYTVSFKPNISLEHEDCDFHISRVLEAVSKNNPFCCFVILLSLLSKTPL